jgi:hypothetical protein
LIRNPVLTLYLDPDQAFQRDAINSVVGIFEGQPLGLGDFDSLFADTLFQETGIGNHDDHSPPNVKYQDRFLKLYREARETKRGLFRE